MESLWDKLIAEVENEKKILTDVELDKLELTYIPEAEIFQCNNCGAYEKDPEKIEHYKTCEEGEAKKYEEAEEVEEVFNTTMSDQLKGMKVG